MALLFKDALENFPSREDWRSALAAVGSAFFIFVAWRWNKSRNQAKVVVERIARHKDLVAGRRQELEQRLREGNGELVTEERRKILALTTDELLLQLSNGHVTPTQALEAYQARALEATSETNCVCDFFLEAAEQARQLELLPAETRGSLYGLPVSLKECFYVQGHPSTAGISRFLEHPEVLDGSLVRTMKALGAVPFCHTNLPQFMKSQTCSNPVYGQTVHPADKTRTCGGSSGGEACLLAQGGSPLGLGTDLSGSIRLPAANCGVAALKPTSGRLCHRGRRGGAAGRIVGVCSDFGFMAPTASALVVANRAMLDDRGCNIMRDLDHEVIPLTWNEKMFSKVAETKLKIGWYYGFGAYQPTPGCKRVLDETVELLRARGHKMVPFSPPRLEDCARMLYAHVLADDGANTLSLMEGGEVWDESCQFQRLVWMTPMWLKRHLLKSVLSWVRGPLTASYACDPSTPYLSKDLWISLDQQHDLVQEFLDAWIKQEFDVVLSPGYMFPAAKIESADKALVCVAFTGVYNVLNLPVGTLRMGFENQDDQVKLEKDYPDNEPLCREIKLSTRGAVGLPLGVQVVGRPWQEEKVLAVMNMLEIMRDGK